MFQCTDQHIVEGAVILFGGEEQARQAFAKKWQAISAEEMLEQDYQAGAPALQSEPVIEDEFNPFDVDSDGINQGAGYSGVSL